MYLSRVARHSSPQYHLRRQGFYYPCQLKAIVFMAKPGLVQFDCKSTNARLVRSQPTSNSVEMLTFPGHITTTSTMALLNSK